MVAELIALVVIWLNELPPPLSIAGDIIPQKIITVITVDYNTDCTLEFVEYSPQGANYFMILTNGH